MIRGNFRWVGDEVCDDYSIEKLESRARIVFIFIIIVLLLLLFFI